MFEETEEMYINLKCKLETITQSRLKALNTADQADKPGVSSSMMVRLPKITIPIFSGKYTEWTSFRDLFVSLYIR